MVVVNLDCKGNRIKDLSKITLPDHINQMIISIRIGGKAV